MSSKELIVEVQVLNFFKSILFSVFLININVALAFNIEGINIEYTEEGVLTFKAVVNHEDNTIFDADPHESLTLYEGYDYFSPLFIFIKFIVNTLENGIDDIDEFGESHPVTGAMNYKDFCDYFELKTLNDLLDEYLNKGEYLLNSLSFQKKSAKNIEDIQYVASDEMLGKSYVDYEFTCRFEESGEADEHLESKKNKREACLELTAKERDTTGGSVVVIFKNVREELQNPSGVVENATGGEKESFCPTRPALSTPISPYDDGNGLFVSSSSSSKMPAEIMIIDTCLDNDSPVDPPAARTVTSPNQVQSVDASTGQKSGLKRRASLDSSNEPLAKVQNSLELRTINRIDYVILTQEEKEVCIQKNIYYSFGVKVHQALVDIINFPAFPSTKKKLACWTPEDEVHYKKFSCNVDGNVELAWGESDDIDVFFYPATQGIRTDFYWSKTGYTEGRYFILINLNNEQLTIYDKSRVKAEMNYLGYLRSRDACLYCIVGGNPVAKLETNYLHKKKRGNQVIWKLSTIK